MFGPFSEVFVVCCLFGRFVKFTISKFQHFKILKLQNFKISTFQNYISTDCNSSFLAFVAIWSCSVCIRYIDWRANSTLSGWSVKISWFSRNMSIFSCFWYFLESQHFDEKTVQFSSHSQQQPQSAAAVASHACNSCMRSHAHLTGSFMTWPVPSRADVRHGSRHPCQWKDDDHACMTWHVTQATLSTNLYTSC